MKPRTLLEWSTLAPLLVLVIGVTVYVLSYTVFARPGRFPVDSDGQGYYAYLPSYLVYHDLSFNAVLNHNILPMYAGLGHQPPKAFGFSLQPNGSWLDKYGIGVAVLLLPFFLVGHILATWLGQHADGYSLVEMFSVGSGAIVYTVAGLFMLRAVLRRWFPDGAVALTLVAIVAGSGALVYMSWLPTINHDYELCAVAATLICVVRWYERPDSWSRVLLLGLSMGMVMLIRLTDVVLLTAVPLLGVGTMAAARARLRLLTSHVARVGAAVVCAIALLVPQALVWNVATGHLVVRSYPGEPFYFTHPQLLGTLFSLRPHGLIPYYPVLGLSLVGLAIAWRRRRDIAVPVTVGFIGFWYVVSSWWDWSFTSAFGDRAFIAATPLLALPLAFLLSAPKRRWQLYAVRACATVLVLVTCVFTITYLQRRLPEDGIDSRGYVQLLVHPHRLLAGPTH